jgi:hypothetical protein
MNSGKILVCAAPQALSRGLIFLISASLRLYQAAVSPLLGRHCRFYPSCSAYAREAFHRKGLGRGSVLALGRLLKCHPFHPGGYDAVPE